MDRAASHPVDLILKGDRIVGIAQKIKVKPLQVDPPVIIHQKTLDPAGVFCHSKYKHIIHTCLPGSWWDIHTAFLQFTQPSFSSHSFPSVHAAFLQFTQHFYSQRSFPSVLNPDPQPLHDPGLILYDTFFKWPGAPDSTAPPQIFVLSILPQHGAFMIMNRVMPEFHVSGHGRVPANL